jgi:hypothetical protein
MRPLLKSIADISAQAQTAEVMPVSTGRYLTKKYHHPGQWPHIWGWGTQTLVNNLRLRLKPQIWGYVAA